MADTAEPAAADHTAEPPPTPDHVADDAAFLMADPDLRDALETLAHRGKDGDLEETRWRRMLGLTENQLDLVTDELLTRELIRDYDSGGLFERWSWVITDRGRAALDAVASEIAKEDRLRRLLGPLTLADLWAHDSLVANGPLPWVRWAGDAKPYLYEKLCHDWRKAGKHIGEDGNYRAPEDTTAFAKAAFKLMKRGFVERREDGTYATCEGPSPRLETA